MAATSSEVQQCHDSAGALQQPQKVVTAGAISRDVDKSHQNQNDQWARSQALREKTVTHMGIQSPETPVKGELRSGTEGATQLTTQNHLQYDKHQTDPYLKLELQHKKGSTGTMLMWKCIETRGRATKVPSDH